MRIFVTGATGYLGFNVATAFRRAGYDVYGLVRTQDKARELAKQEVHPVLGTMEQPDGYAAIAADCSVLIHAAADTQGDMFALDRKTVEALLSLSKKGPQPKTLIYTSGVWVYGNTGTKVADETTLVNPPKLVSARPKIEQTVLNAEGVRGLVMRPGCLYGKQGGLTAMWFKDSASHHILTVVGEGHNHWAMVHVNDAAEGYLRAAESELSGEIFNLVDQSRSSLRDMVAAVARSTRYSGDIQSVPLVNATQTMGDFADCLALDQRIKASKAQRLLGWHARHGSFADDVETYLLAWKAYQT